jgi:hypothetical protein
MRRQQLTEAQITALLDPPTEQRELVRQLHIIGCGPRSDPALSWRS